jgi:predicted kinase
MKYSKHLELPLLIVITGRPGSGKTTLAHSLAREIRCPAICRDEIKEGLVNTIGNSAALDNDLNWQVYDVFFETVEFLLSKNITLIAEAAFQHKLWIPKLEPLQKIAQIRLIHCSIDPKLARERFIKRGLSDPKRVHFHSDKAVHAAKEEIELPLVNYEPPRMAVPTLTIDTSDRYSPNFEKIAIFAYNSEVK